MTARLKRRRRWFLLVLAALGLVPTYLRPYRISGASEVPTVLVGDQIIVNHAAYVLNAPYSRTRLFRTGSPKSLLKTSVPAPPNLLHNSISV
jgi:signal peptidase I